MVLDKLLVHVIVVYSVWLSLSAHHVAAASFSAFWLCLAYIVMVYYVAGLSHLPAGRWEAWHASLHVASCVGEIALLLGCRRA